MKNIFDEYQFMLYTKVNMDQELTQNVCGTY
jgi:hypothetical protein